MRIGFQPVLDLSDGLLDIISKIDVDMSYRRVSSLIDADDGVKQFVDPSSRPCRGGDDRHADHLAEELAVEADTGTVEFVDHVQGYDHAAVHVDKLGGQIEISFEIRSIHHINYNVRSFITEIFPDIEFLRRVGG